MILHQILVLWGCLGIAVGILITFPIIFGTNVSTKQWIFLAIIHGPVGWVILAFAGFFYAVEWIWKKLE